MKVTVLVKSTLTKECSLRWGCKRCPRPWVTGPAQGYCLQTEVQFKRWQSPNQWCHKQRLCFNPYQRCYQWLWFIIICAISLISIEIYHWLVYFDTNQWYGTNDNDIWIEAANNTPGQGKLAPRPWDILAPRPWEILAPRRVTAYRPKFSSGDGNDFNDFINDEDVLILINDMTQTMMIF